jgi:hypothetical protein
MISTIITAGREDINRLSTRKSESIVYKSHIACHNY